MLPIKVAYYITQRILSPSMKSETILVYSSYDVMQKEVVQHPNSQCVIPRHDSYIIVRVLELELMQTGILSSLALYGPQP